MDKREVKIDYFTYANSYPKEYNTLCEKAVGTVGNAYSIYSGFSVGAAVLLCNGEVVTGTNQENLAYPSGMCAERTALYYACSQYPDAGIKAMAIAAGKNGVLTADVVTPCGACRQVMSEVVRRYGRDFDVVMIGAGNCIKVKASALLPFSFDTVL